MPTEPVAIAPVPSPAPSPAPPVVESPKVEAPKGPDPRDVQHAARDRAWQRQQLAAKNELAREREALSRERAEFKATQESLLAQFARPESQQKELPPEIVAELAKRDETIAQLKRSQDARDQADRQRAGKETFDQAMSVFEKMTLESTATPLAAAMATRDPPRLRAMATQIVRGDSTLQDDEILAMIEEELGFYVGLAPKRVPPPEDPAVSSDVPAPAKAHPGTPIATPPNESTKASQARLTASQRTAAAIDAVRKARESRRRGA